MDKYSVLTKGDNDKDKKHEEENDWIMDQLLNVPSPPSESPKQETVATTGDSAASTWSAFSWFRLVLQAIAEYLYIPQLRLRFSHMFQMHKGKQNLSKENKINLLLDNEKSFKKKYKVELKLGSGAYGIVYKVTPKVCDKELPEPLALKILCGDLMYDPQTTLNEIKKNFLICKKDSCQNVVSFFSYNEYTYQEYRYICLEMELCDGGTLKKSNFHEHKYVTDTFRKKVLEQSISGMLFIHECGVAHWDIHGGNILFKSPADDTIKFGDFGLTRESPSSQDLDIQDLGRTLLKWVFLRESDLSENASEIEIENLLCTVNVQKDVRKILEGLTFNTMSLSEAQRRIIEIKGWNDLGVRERSIIERQTERDRVWALSEYRARRGSWNDLGVRERSIIERQTERDRVWALSEYRARRGIRCPTAFEFARFLDDIEEEFRQRIKELEDQVELLRLAMSAHDVLDLRI
ncbi:mitogen-activated protein kinase 15-like [Saccostrea cucullata]|uniref:mitogen-activated protein kinase 15-like n=1 Tax=Saccostrea cuccullata TaxID=36930 RepID=UPI002ED00E6C